MDPLQIRQALLEVRHLRRSILEKQLFRGYSGRARVLGGLLALLAGILGQAQAAKMGESGLFVLWGIVFALAVLVNYGPVVSWFCKSGNRSDADLAFVLEVLPVWLVAGVLTLVLRAHGQADLLYGCWMCLFGLAQSIGRSRLPRQMTWIGAFYLACGIACLLFAEGLFLMPLAVGCVFFAGELGAGIIMHCNGDLSGIRTLLHSGK